MAKKTKPRIRRGREEARRAILEAAEKRLQEGGPDAVRVQHVAADVGITDAAIHHHFGSRAGLLESLLKFAGRRLRTELERSLESWDGKPADVQRVATLISDTYSGGYARLALWLTLSGWEPPGSGMFKPLIDALHRSRLAVAQERSARRPRREEVQREVALMNLALAAEPLMGRGFLRSVGLDAEASEQEQFRRWLVRRLSMLLTTGTDCPDSSFDDP